MRLTKPIESMTPQEKAALVARMKADGTYDDDFVGFLGNVNHLLWALPASGNGRRKSSARKMPAKARA